ncbi:MAG: MotA/TolQ/ExbB proton channel family protein [Planctomycetota bacterium]
MKHLTRATLSAVALNILLTVALVAEEGEVMEEAGTGGGQSLLGAIIGSGPVEWVLILLSIVGMSLAIQRIMTIKAEFLVPEDLVDDLHNIFADGVTDDALEEATNIVADDETMLGQIVYAALDKKDLGYDAMREAAESVGAAEHNKYMAQINWLQLLASIGPMLGLLGTVVGMIQAFFTMARAGGSVDPAQLSDSIGGAMITTATGLIIAIPMLFFYFFLRARVNKCVLEAGVMVGEIMDYFRNR